MTPILAKNGKRYRFGLGPETVLTFNSVEKTTMQLNFQLHNLIPGQEVSIWVNGTEKRHFTELNHRGKPVTGTVEFESVAGRNEIRLVYADWNHKQTAYFPKDARPVAINILALAIQ